MQHSVNTRPNILTCLEVWKHPMTHCFYSLTEQKKVVFNLLTYLPHDSVHEGSQHYKNKRFDDSCAVSHVDVEDTSLLPVKIWPSNPLLKTCFPLGGGSKLSSRSSSLTEHCTFCTICCYRPITAKGRDFSHHFRAIVARSVAITPDKTLFSHPQVKISQQLSATQEQHRVH